MNDTFKSAGAKQARHLTGAWMLVVLLTSLPLAVMAQESSPAPSVPSSEAVPTTVVVRAASNDAKLLQDPVGGARIVIRNAETGAVLAEGTQTGDSGSTEQIMQQPHKRGEDIYATPGAGRFQTTLDLSAPTKVRIEATGPLDYPQAMQTTSKTVLLLPGADIEGDGVVLTLHGFIVEVLSPGNTANAAPGDTVDVSTRVRMLCGCPTEPGGMWDADQYTITAQLLRNGTVVAEEPMTFTGRTSEYIGAVVVPDEGATHVRVTAGDAARVNFGMAEQPLTTDTSSP